MASAYRKTSVWIIPFLGLLWAIPGLSHAISSGKSLFAIDSQGRVEVAIELQAEDLHDFFDTDLRDPKQDRTLDQKFREHLDGYLELQTDGGPCKLSYQEFRRNSARTVLVIANALCPSAPTRLRVDWGLSRAGETDIRSHATLRAPDGSVKLYSLSRRHPTADFSFARITAPASSPPWLFFWGIVFLVYFFGIREEED